MIKLIEILTRRHGTDHAAFVERCAAALGSWAAAAVGERPSRIACCEVLHDVDGTDRRSDVVVLAWCDDADHLARASVAWRAIAATDLKGLVDTSRTCRMVADEEARRGGDWLDERWRSGGPKLKHMAVAHRAPHLTPEQFSELWRSRAGTVKQGSGAVTSIPDDVRGLAYVQNHTAGRSDVDAVNEVYFDDRASLERRVAWFAEQLPDGEDDLVGEHWFLAARETVIT